MSDTIFPEGLWFNLPHEKAPSFVKGSVSVDIAKFARWAEQHANERGRFRINLKVGKSGKAYAELDTYKAESAAGEYEAERRKDAQWAKKIADMDDEIPF